MKKTFNYKRHNLEYLTHLIQSLIFIVSIIFIIIIISSFPENFQTEKDKITIIIVLFFSILISIVLINFLNINKKLDLYEDHIHLRKLFWDKTIAFKDIKTIKVTKITSILYFGLISTRERKITIKYSKFPWFHIFMKTNYNNGIELISLIKLYLNKTEK